MAEFKTILSLPQPTWQWSMTPDFEITFNQTGRMPNAVHRAFLRLLLGIHVRPTGAKR